MAVKIGTEDWSFTPVYAGQRKPAVVHDRQHVVTIDGHLGDVQQMEAAAEAALAIQGRTVSDASGGGVAVHHPARSRRGRGLADRRR